MQDASTLINDGINDGMMRPAIFGLHVEGGVGSSTVYRTKRRFVLGNLEAALSEEPRPGANRKLLGQGGSPAGGNGLFKSTRGARSLDVGAAGWRTGQAHCPRERVARDGASAPGGKQVEAMAQGHVVHPRSTPTTSPAWRTCSISMPKRLTRAAGGLLRREPDPAHRRGAPADPARARANRALRLRI